MRYILDEFCTLCDTNSAKSNRSSDKLKLSLNVFYPYRIYATFLSLISSESSASAGTGIHIRVDGDNQPSGSADQATPFIADLYVGSAGKKNAFVHLGKKDKATLGSSSAAMVSAESFDAGGSLKKHSSGGEKRKILPSAGVCSHVLATAGESKKVRKPSAPTTTTVSSGAVGVVVSIDNGGEADGDVNGEIDDLDGDDYDDDDDDHDLWQTVSANEGALRERKKLQQVSGFLTHHAKLLKYATFRFQYSRTCKVLS